MSYLCKFINSVPSERSPPSQQGARVYVIDGRKRAHPVAAVLRLDALARIEKKVARVSGGRRHFRTRTPALPLHWMNPKTRQVVRTLAKIIIMLLADNCSFIMPLPEFLSNLVNSRNILTLSNMRQSDKGSWCISERALILLLIFNCTSICDCNLYVNCINCFFHTISMLHFPPLS
jgi:hypothetical protein